MQQSLSQNEKGKSRTLQAHKQSSTYQILIETEPASSSRHLVIFPLLNLDKLS
jgi:hypothetical protein